MAEVYAEIPIAALLLDTQNPRLSGRHSTQQEVALRLAQQQGDSIVRLAHDIVTYGVDPTASLAVVATDKRKQYRVIEGNRRLLAIRALDTPALVYPALSQSSRKRLDRLSAEYEKHPLDSLRCVIFDTEEDAFHWIELRHTGENQGVGLVGWGADEQDRFRARHHGVRKPAGQIIDFVDKFGTLSDSARSSGQKIMTNLERIINMPFARETLGIDIKRGQVVSLYPAEEIVPLLTKIVEDLKSGDVKVSDLYTAEDRQRYIERLPRKLLPKASARLQSPIALDDLEADRVLPGPQPEKRIRKKSPSSFRTTVIPRSTSLEIASPRIASIYKELRKLNAEHHPNACAVLLRVFIELSVDHFIEAKKLIDPVQMRNLPLAKRLKAVTSHLREKKRIPEKLFQAIESMADSNHSVLGAPLATFNQYVHNQYVFPKPDTLYLFWNEVAPFMEKVWQ